MSSHPELRLDWCSYEAAKYAVEHWHYSRRMPTPPHVILGAWEDSRFVGVVVFSRGAAPRSASPFGISTIEIAELTRVALRDHQSPVSRILRIAVIMLRQQCPGLRLLISYADPEHGHIGGIYQAAGWLFLGRRPGTSEYIAPDGKRWHSRMISPTGRKKVYGRYRPVWKPEQCTLIRCAGKWKYALPLDDEMRARILPLAKPYPKRVRSETSDTSAIHAEEGGAAPTLTLQFTGKEAQRG